MKLLLILLIISVTLLLPIIALSQDLEGILDVIIPDNNLIARIPGSDLLGRELGYGALGVIFAGGETADCDIRSLFYHKSIAIKCDKFYLDYENSNSVAFVEEESGDIVLVATKETLDPFTYFGFVGENPIKITSEREARHTLGTAVRETLIQLLELRLSGLVNESTSLLQLIYIFNPETGRSEPQITFRPKLGFEGRTKDLNNGLQQLEDYERIYNSVEQTLDPALFVAVKTEEGWKFYWLITVKRDRYNVQQGWESNVLTHIVIDATEQDELFSRDITPYALIIGYTPITEQEISSVIGQSQEHINLFLQGTYTKVEKFNGAVVCQGDLIALVLCSISTENPESKELFSISNEDSSVITDSDGNLIFVSSTSGRAFEYIGFAGEFTDVHEAYDIVTQLVTTDKPLKISFVAVKRNEEFRLLYVFYNAETIKIIDAITGSVVY